MPIRINYSLNAASNDATNHGSETIFEGLCDCNFLPSCRTDPFHLFTTTNLTYSGLHSVLETASVICKHAPCHGENTPWWKTAYYTGFLNLVLLGPRCALNHSQFLSCPYVRLTAFHHSSSAFYYDESGLDCCSKVEGSTVTESPRYLLNSHKIKRNLIWLKMNKLWRENYCF